MFCVMRNPREIKRAVCSAQNMRSAQCATDLYTISKYCPRYNRAYTPPSASKSA
jgi:hypothetical protein